MNENRYCVYLHRRKDTNEVFYVGSGNSDRPTSKTRQQYWLDYVKQHPYYIDVVEQELTMSEARDLEQEYIIKYSTTVINRVSKVAKTRSIDYKSVSEYLKYDKCSPSGLTWIKSIRSGNNLNRTVSIAGDVAGFKVADNSWRVGLGGKVYLAHRVIYLLMNGAIDDNCLIDHIDGDPSNNLIENLREVSHAVNMRNRKKTNNSTGTTGVYFTSVPSGNKTSVNNYYMATVYLLDGKYSTKKFNTAKYGEAEAFRLACEWRTARIKELNENGAGYTDRHGT